jgi:hypothetical protein
MACAILFVDRNVKAMGDRPVAGILCAASQFHAAVLFWFRSGRRGEAKKKQGR